VGQFPGDDSWLVAWQTAKFQPGHAPQVVPHRVLSLGQTSRKHCLPLGVG